MERQGSSSAQPQVDQYRCDICGRTHTSKALLAGHVRRCHPKYGSRSLNLNSLSSPNETGGLRRDMRTTPAVVYQRRSIEDLYAPNSNVPEPFVHNGTNMESNGIQELHPTTSELSQQSNEQTNYGNQPPSRNLEPSAANKEVAGLVSEFFKSYGDTSSQLFDSCKQPEPPFENLHISCQNVISSCTTRQLTLGEIRDEWKLLANVESQISLNQRYITRTFPTADKFAVYIDNLRRWTVRSEGWRKACIKTEGGMNETGVFRPGLNLLLEEIEKVGGVDSIQPFEEQQRNGDRVYSSPWNSEAMQRFEEVKEQHGRGDATIAGVDIYCDGTALAKSGSQSAHTLRIRFPFLKGRSNIWHEIGVTPSLVPRTDRRPRKRPEIRRERIELFHRFLFLALEDLINISGSGLLYNGTLIIPRVLMVVADQPQEREFVSLKGADSYRDCTQCIMVSRQKDEIKRRRPARDKSLAQDTRPTKRVRRPTMSSPPDIGESSDCYSDVSDAGSSRGSVTSDTIQPGSSATISVQLSQDGAAPRDVSHTVLAQLSVALQKRGMPVDAIPFSIRQGARAYLESMSATPYPPALAAFHGLGSAPFHLYTSCAFDKLHAFDLGLLRLIPDLAFERYSDTDRSGIPMSQTMEIANQRVHDLPRCCRLPGIDLFRLSKTEKQSGMTGLIRREFAPFIWVFLIGLDRTVVPDNDDIVQASLKLAQLQAEMIGINQNPKRAERTSAEIRRLEQISFEAGTLLVSALDTRVTTKIHRVMRHIGDHLNNFGCLRRGSTDENEVLHKVTKKAYRGTNHKLAELAPQLLNARVMIQCSEATAAVESDLDSVLPNANFQSRLLLTRHPKLQPTQAPTGAQNTNTNALDVENQSILNPTPTHAGTPPPDFSQLFQTHSKVHTPEQTELRIRQITTTLSHSIVWEQKKMVTFAAKLHWAEEVVTRQTIFAGSHIHGVSDRRNPLEYHAYRRTFHGIVQAIFKHRQTGFVFLLVRRMVEAQPMQGNVKIVEEYGLRRYRYAMNAKGNVIMDYVELKDVQRQIVIVPDYYDLVKRYGVKMRSVNVAQTKEERRRARYFEVATYKYTSFPEQSC